MRNLSKWLSALGSAAILYGAPSVVQAQEQQRGEVYEDEDYVYEEDEYGYEYDEKAPDHLVTGLGTGVMIGGAGTGFADEEARDFVDTGGAWDLQLIFGTRTPLALQLGYQGTASDINAVGLDTDTILLSNGGDATLRWNILQTFMGPMELGGMGTIEPYAMGGVGYRRYDLINSDFNTSNVQDSDNMGEVPVGGGIAWLANGFILDVGGSYRFAFEDNLFGDTENSPSLDRWEVGANLGFEF